MSKNKEIKPMTRKEFNERYYIEATVMSYQRANLAEDNRYEDIEYGMMTDTLETIGYVVMDNETHDVVFEVEHGNELEFIRELKKEFAITD